MNATTFDNLSAARRLKAAGLEEKQAETIAEIMHEALVADRKDVTGCNWATKDDLAVVEARIRAEIATVVNRTVFTLLAGMVVLFAALKLF